MAALIIEVNHGAHNTSFHRVTSYPFTIGRAYDNDLILADETVSEHHLQLECHLEGNREDNLESADENYFVRNLSTENGTWCGGSQLGGEAEVLKPPLSLTLGRTHIKILAVDTPVTPTLNFPHASRATRWASDLRVALGLLSIYFLLTIFFALERQSLWLNWEEVLVNQLFEIALPLLVATAIGFVSRMLLHRWRFALQLSIACIALSLLTFSGEITAVISYWLTNDQVAADMSSIFIALCFIGLLAWQLRAVSTLSRRRAGWTGVAIVVPLFLVWELQAVINQPAFQVNPPMHTLLKPQDLRLANNFQSVDEFRQSVESELHTGLKQELEKSEITFASDY